MQLINPGNQLKNIKLILEIHDKSQLNHCILNLPEILFSMFYQLGHQHQSQLITNR